MVEQSDLMRSHSLFTAVHNKRVWKVVMSVNQILNTMEWKQLKIWVYSEAVDPGIVHHDSFLTTFEPDEIHVGERLHYEDPGQVLASLTVVEVNENWVTLRVGETKEVRLWPGESKDLDTGGRDYTNFYLQAHLEPSYDEDSLLAPDEEPDDDGRYDAWA